MKKLLFNRYTLILAIAAISYIIGSFKPLPKESIKQIILDTKNTFSSSAVSNIKIDTIRISIDPKDYELFQENRKIALENGFLQKEYRHKSKAHLIFEGDTSKISIRLKGDFSDHWSHPYKWSFKVKVKGDDNFKGLTTFNLQRPITRQRVSEWYFHEMLKDNDIMHLQYTFVRAFINDKDLGIYAIEECVDNPLIKRNGRPLGVCFKLNTSKHFARRYGVNKDGLISSCPIEPYGLKKMNEKNQQYQDFLTGSQLIKDWVNKKTTIDKVFDIDKMSCFLAILDLTGHQHSHRLDNSKLYYNPSTGLIEPVGYDNSGFDNLNNASFIRGNRRLLGERREINKENATAWGDMLFNNEAMYTAYLKHLNRLSTKENMDKFHADRKAQVDSLEKIIQFNSPFYQFDGDEILTINAKFIQDYLNPFKGIEAYVGAFDKKNQNISIDLSNTHYTPFIIQQVRFEDQVIYTFDKPLLLQCNPNSTDSYQTISIPFSEELAKTKKYNEKILIDYHVLGCPDKAFSVESYPWSYAHPETTEGISALRDGNHKDFSFIKTEDDKVIIPSGNWTIDKNLSIANNKILTIEAGANITLKNKANILCNEGIDINGTSENIVSIKGEDGGGILVMNATNTSNIKHTVFSNLGKFKIGEWENKSGLTFYNSDLEINQSLFYKGVAKQQLEIIRSGYQIAMCKFENSTKDALMIMASEGDIKACDFKNIGENALTFNAGKASIMKSNFNQIGKVALTGTARNYVLIDQCNIDQAKYALVSIDDAHVDFNSSSISNSETAYVSFRANKDFEPALLTARWTKMKEVKNIYIAQGTSIVNIDNVIQASTHKDFELEK